MEVKKSIVLSTTPPLFEIVFFFFFKAMCVCMYACIHMYIYLCNELELEEGRDIL